jgi:hypothetical protein
MGRAVDFYIFQAECYCENCVEKLKAELRKIEPEPANSDDETTFDSNEWPKGPFSDEESDSPDHCSNCGVFLENPLTSAGYKYVKEYMRDDPNSDVVKEWAEFYELSFLEFVL